MREDEVNTKGRPDGWTPEQVAEYEGKIPPKEKSHEIPELFYRIADLVAPATLDEKSLYEDCQEVARGRLRFGRYGFDQAGLDGPGGCVCSLCHEMYRIDSGLFSDIFGEHHLNLLNPLWVMTNDLSNYGWDVALVESASHEKFRHAQDVSAYLTLYKPAKRVATLQGKWVDPSWRVASFALAMQNSPRAWRRTLQETKSPTKLLLSLGLDPSLMKGVDKQPIEEKEIPSE